MTNPTSNFGWQMPTASDLVTDLPADFEVFGQAVDTSLADLKGGTSGQVLSKASNTDMDFTWVTSDDANAIQNAIVDAKGDLIAASAADTPARLAVGNNGETLVADSSTSTGLRYQAPKTNNVVINGNLDWWQRGTSFAAVTNAAYTADRWETTYGGTGVSITASQETTVPNVNSEYSLKYLQASGNATSLTEYCARQKIEQSNILPLLGKSAILSFWYRSNKTGSHAIRIYAGYNTGGGDQVTSFTVNAADTWEYKTIAVTALSTASASSASPTAAGALVDIGFRVNTVGFTTVSLNDYFQFTQVQLEVGSVATPFARAGGTIQGELAAAMRYYQRLNSVTAYGGISGIARVTSQSAGGVAAWFPAVVPMRVTPTALDSGGAWQLYGSGAHGLTSISLNADNPATLSFVATSSGATINQVYALIANNNAASYLGWSAEL
jgi:hypothetical protein